MHPLLQRLRRITSGATWIPEIDGLRFVAIASVVLFHIGGQVISKSGQAWTTQSWYLPTLKFITNSNRGVELFFVISGFILGRPFARQYLLGEKRVSLGSYYLRRLTRLEPPYVINLLLFSIAIFFYVHTPVMELTKHFLASAFYIHELVYHQASTINGVTWSLELEIQFYLLVPLLVLVYRIRNSVLRRSVLVAAIIFFSGLQEWAYFQNFWGRPGEILYETVFSFLQFFLAGLLLSDLYLTALPRWRPSVLWDIAGLVCWPAYFFINANWEALALPPLLIVVFVGAFRGIYFPRLFRVQWIALIGGMCYSIYLWHFFLIAFVFKVSRYVVVGHDYLANLLLQCVLLLPPVLLFSTLYYLLVERPCMDPKWPQKLMGKGKTAANASAAAS